MSTSIDLGHDTPHLASPAVYRNGKIYMAGNQCIYGDGKTCLHAVNIVVIPVRRDGNKIVANKSIHEGFIDFMLGGDYGHGGSYEIPAIEVNKDNDIAVVYDRAEPDTAKKQEVAFEPGSYYSIYLHDETGHHDGVLHKADCDPGPKSCALESPEMAGLDVAGIAVDPSDDTTFWMSHGYASATSKRDVLGTYKMVIGSVTARTQGYIPAHPTQVP